MLNLGHPRTRLRFKVIMSGIVMTLAVALGLMKVVPFLIPFLVIIFVGLYVNLQLCWNCRAPYTLPRIRGIWKNLGTCLVCGSRIEDDPKFKGSR